MAALVEFQADTFQLLIDAQLRTEVFKSGEILPLLFEPVGVFFQPGFVLLPMEVKLFQELQHQLDVRSLQIKQMAGNFMMES